MIFWSNVTLQIRPSNLTNIHVSPPTTLPFHVNIYQHARKFVNMTRA